MMLNDWFLVEVPTENGKKKEVILTSRIGLKLWGNTLAIMEMCEKLSSADVCYSPLLGRESHEKDSQVQRRCL